MYQPTNKTIVTSLKQRTTYIVNNTINKLSISVKCISIEHTR